MITELSDMSTTETQHLMLSKGFRYLPIVDEKGMLMGLITKGSLASALPSGASNLSRFEVSYVLATVKVKSVMPEDVITTTPDTPIEIAARMMVDNLIECLPILENDKLVGIITDRRLLITMVTLLGGRREDNRVTVHSKDTPGNLQGVSFMF